MYDIDRNGYIEKKRNEKNYGCYLWSSWWRKKKGANSPEIKVDQIFSKMDVNSDQKLSKDEFVTGCLQDDYLRKLLAPSAS